MRFSYKPVTATLALYLMLAQVAAADSSLGDSATADGSPGEFNTAELENTRAKEVRAVQRDALPGELLYQKVFRQASSDVGAFTIEEKTDRLLISLHDKPATQFVFRDEKILRPYFAAVHAPNGLQVTRNHPPIAGTDAADHDTMHPGLWLGFGDISGNDYWRNKSRIEHLRFIEPPSAKGDELTFATESQLLTPDGQPLCRMVCRFTLVSRRSGWLLIWDTVFHADNRDVVFGDQEEMGFGARVATPMTEKNGGRILNSNGLQTAARTWGQPAKWCDYSKAVGFRQGGITLMAASSNFRESWWHNRDYGVFVANPFGRAAMKQGRAQCHHCQAGRILPHHLWRIRA